MTADIHLDAFCKERNKWSWRGLKKKEKKENGPEARAGNGGESVIMVTKATTKATACCPVGKGGTWWKVRRLRYNQLNHI